MKSNQPTLQEIALQFLGTIEKDGHYLPEITNTIRRALLPEPEGPSDEEWDAIKDSLWRNYETVGYQGERFMYEGDFYTAMDVSRQELTRCTRPTTQPVPVSERLLGPGDCDTE